MQMEIHHPCSEMSDAVLHYVEQRARSKLAQFSPYILHLTVFLDEAGQLRPGGGIHCRIVVAVLGVGRISADLLDVRLTVAIDRAPDHIAHALARDLGRPSIPAVALPAPVRLTPAMVFQRLRQCPRPAQLRQHEDARSFGVDFL